MDFIFSIKNHYFEKGTPWVELDKIKQKRGEGMSYKQCPFCGEKNIQRGYGTGVDGPWIGCPSCQYWIRGNDCVRRWNSRCYEKEIMHLKGRIEQLEKEKAKLYDRCLENEEAMYDAVINGNDNHLIELVENGVNKI